MVTNEQRGDDSLLMTSEKTDFCKSSFYGFENEIYIKERLQKFKFVYYIYTAMLKVQ